MDNFPETVMSKARDIGYKALQHNDNDNQPDDINETRRDWPRLVPATFEKWAALPDPQSYDPQIKALSEALDLLRFGSAGGSILDGKFQQTQPNHDFELLASPAFLRNWSGTAADNFFDNIVTPVKRYTHSNYLIISALRASLEAHKALYAAARQDVYEIQDKYWAILNKPFADPNAFGGGGDDIYATVGSVFTVLAAIGTIVATGGAAEATLGLNFLVVSANALSGSVSALAHNDRKDVTINRESIHVIAQMNQRLDELEARIAKGIDKIGEGLERAIHEISAPTQPKSDLIAPRPHLGSRESLGEPG